MKRFITILCSLLIGNSLSAQHYEVGTLIGTTLYGGDLSLSHITIPQSKFATGAFFRYHPSPYAAIALRYHQGILYGDDARSKSPDRIKRNLHFRSPIAVLSITPEIYIPGFDPLSKRFSPYFFQEFPFTSLTPKQKLTVIGSNCNRLAQKDKVLKVILQNIPLNVLLG